MLEAGCNPDALIYPEPEDPEEVLSDKYFMDILGAASKRDEKKKQELSRKFLAELEEAKKRKQQQAYAKPTGGTPVLSYAINSGSKQYVPALIKAGANLDLIDEQGRTALIWSVLNEEEKICEQLLKAGAKPEIKDKKRKTALHYAKKYQLQEIIDLLQQYTKQKGIFGFFC